MDPMELAGGTMNPYVLYILLVVEWFDSLNGKGSQKPQNKEALFNYITRSYTIINVVT
jgi:hypothetical protein